MPEDLPPVVVNEPSLPLVSIVTPSYNQGIFIRETIESVLQQDYPNIEYWVIDGGSTDETLSILKQYEHDPRFHWISEKDSGQSDAINKGLARCQGKIFNWLCSDDLLLPGALRHIVDAWALLPQPSIIYGWVRLIDQYGNDLGYGPRQSPNVTLRRMLRSDCFPMQQATFIPTEYVRAVGGVDSSFSYAMDLDLYIRLIEKFPFRHVPFVLALYRLHGASKTVSHSAQFIDDVTQILERASRRRLIPQRQAISYVHLFAAKVYLTPEAWDWRCALKRLGRAVGTDPLISGAAVFSLLKGAVRRFAGETRWRPLRHVLMILEQRSSAS